MVATFWTLALSLLAVQSALALDREDFFLRHNAYAMVEKFLGDKIAPGKHVGVTEDGDACDFTLSKDTDAIQFTPSVTDPKNLTFKIDKGPSSPLLGGIFDEELWAVRRRDADLVIGRIDPNHPRRSIRRIPGQYSTELQLTLIKTSSGDWEKIQFYKVRREDHNSTRLGFFKCLNR
jgi:hypothetical protein